METLVKFFVLTRKNIAEGLQTILEEYYVLEYCLINKKMDKFEDIVLHDFDIELSMDDHSRFWYLFRKELEPLFAIGQSEKERWQFYTAA